MKENLKKAITEVLKSDICLDSAFADSQARRLIGYTKRKKYSGSWALMVSRFLTTDDLYTIVTTCYKISLWCVFSPSGEGIVIYKSPKKKQP